MSWVGPAQNKPRYSASAQINVVGGVQTKQRISDRDTCKGTELRSSFVLFTPNTTPTRCCLVDFLRGLALPDTCHTTAVKHRPFVLPRSPLRWWLHNASTCNFIRQRVLLLLHTICIEMVQKYHKPS